MNNESGGLLVGGAAEEQPMTDPLVLQPEGYEEFLRDLKQRIRNAQVRAALAVNRELVLLYWQIGRDVIARQQEHGWGAKVIDRLAADLRRAFPDMQGFSPRNLKYMRSFAETWPDEQIVQAVLAQMTWYHNIAILEKLKLTEERLWYARQTIQYGWSRNVLVHQIESGLYHRQGKALTNFARTLPEPQSELAQQIVKDPYNFDFLTE
jgi:predicted nuclease of restriction endonuclease-like (RecB) superfamily